MFEGLLLILQKLFDSDTYLYQNIIIKQELDSAGIHREESYC